MHGDALDATKPMGKRLPKAEVYIETTDAAVDGGGNVACAVEERRPVAACGEDAEQVHVSRNAKHCHSERREES